MRSWSSACFGVFKKGSIGDECFNNINYELPKFHQSYMTVNQQNIFVVELNKKEDATLGIVISGGVDCNTRPKIANLRPGSVAFRCDALSVGDYLLSVNGIKTYNLKHGEIVNLIKCSGEKVTLEIECETPESSLNRVSSAVSKVIQVKLDKEHESFGFTLRQCNSLNHQNYRPFIITNVRYGGPANRIGIIKAGDQLLAIDDFNLTSVTLPEALEALNRVNHSALLTIEYQVSVIDAVESATGPLLVEIDKPFGYSLGISLASISIPEPAIVIESIRQASVAERCGALHVGDRILAVDGIQVDLMMTTQAMQLLQSSKSGNLKLEILPVSQVVVQALPQSQQGWSPSGSDLSGSSQNVSKKNAGYALNINNYRKNQGNMSSGCLGSLCVPYSEIRTSWNKGLEVLDSQYLKDTQLNILGCNEICCEQTLSTDENDLSLNDSASQFSEENMSRLNMQIHQLDYHLDKCNKVVCHHNCKTLTKFKQNQNNFLSSSYCSECNEGLNQAVPTFPAAPVEIHRVTLFKDQVYEDFGFSLSDGKFETGVFINCIRPGGPADVSGLIKPLDKLLQVNNTQACHAGLVVPLIASSGDRLELIICRPAFKNECSSDHPSNSVCTCPWIDRNID